MRKYRLLLILAAITLLLCGSNVYADERQMVIIGDSRTEDLHAAVGDEGCIWAHKVGEGLYWMRDVAVPEVDDYIGSNSAVVILMGVNDAGYTGTAHEYVSYINAKAADWAARGAVTYYFSVCPINEDIYRGNDVTNADIIAWNDIMRSGLSEDVIYVDVYNDIMEVMDTPDGMHYQRGTSTRWFELIKEAVAGNPSDPGVLEMPELTYDRVNVWIDTNNGKIKLRAYRDDSAFDNPGQDERLKKLERNADKISKAAVTSWVNDNYEWIKEQMPGMTKQQLQNGLTVSSIYSNGTVSIEPKKSAKQLSWLGFPNAEVDVETGKILRTGYDD